METVIPISSTARRNFVIFSLIFFGAIIVKLLYNGDPANSLHTSALAWSFGMWGVTFGTYVFGIGVDMYVQYANRK